MYQCVHGIETIMHSQVIFVHKDHMQAILAEYQGPWVSLLYLMVWSFNTGYSLCHILELHKQESRSRSVVKYKCLGWYTDFFVTYW